MMRIARFGASAHKAIEGNPKWNTLIQRQHELYGIANDIRSPFARDYTRILHCMAYRRLKHKTQVFFATQNDHVCTRIEHVNHVASVSYTIARELGLNTELTDAIAIGHDLGHAPFGHEGETVLKDIAGRHIGERFWHEKNSLHLIDNIETLPNHRGFEENLNLTYAVRDGIACHCGEINEQALIPRDDAVDLGKIQKPSEYPPFTWEGCVVKIADKISYLGRDIEDALTVRVLDRQTLRPALKEFRSRMRALNPGLRGRVMNTTVLMSLFIGDLCIQSNPRSGLTFSEPVLELMNRIKEFNYEHIYKNKRLDYFKKYARLIIESVFERLYECYAGRHTLSSLAKSTNHSLLGRMFAEWLIRYSNAHVEAGSITGFGLDINPNKLKNTKIYDLRSQEDYCRSIIDFISGMTDTFAIKVFGELTTF